MRLAPNNWKSPQRDFLIGNADRFDGIVEQDYQKLKEVLDQANALGLSVMKPVFDIVAEPKGKTYIDLLNFAASRCESFSLVWRDQFKFGPTAYEIKRALRPFLVSNIRTDEWPGTKLIGHEAIVRRYRVADESIKLLHAAGGLYAWLRPNLPEDLAFYSSGDVVWLAAISHEHEAWLLDKSLLPAEIYAYVPDIKIREHAGRRFP